MKKLIKITTMVIIALLCQLFAVAQPNDRPRPPKGGHMPPEEFVKELKLKLNLTGEQETKIRNILEAQREEMKKMFESKNEEMKNERDAMRITMEKQRRETDAKISVVLTVEQKKKYEELQTEQSHRLPVMPKPEDEQDRPRHEQQPDHLE
jgi:Spy/CpxP family protein refolding chaperone